MHLLNLIQLCYPIFTLIDGYVLLAANLDDFRSIAKRFVPGKLADKLVAMANEPSNTEKSEEVYYQESKEKSMESYEINVDDEGIKQQHEKARKPREERPKIVREESEEDREESEEVRKQPEVVMQQHKEVGKVNKRDDVADTRVKLKDLPNINIDDIVEKVKERLEKEYILKLTDAAKTVKPNRDDETTGKKYEINDSGSKNDDYDDRKPIRNIESTQYIIASERFTRDSSYRYTTQQYVDIIAREPKRGKISKKPADKIIQNDYENDEKNANSDETVHKVVTDKNTRLFDAVDMLKSNDSYEDYVTPKKYQIFESKETSYPKRYNVKAKTGQDPQLSQSVWPKQKVSTDYDYNGTPGEIKARTENLMFDEKDMHREIIKHVTVNGTNIATKKFKSGTMIPTKPYYKISSPNYYAKLPIIAEKYDFNEPIPERDREREDLRSIGNPPASINRKIKLL